MPIAEGLREHLMFHFFDEIQSQIGWRDNGEAEHW